MATKVVRIDSNNPQEEKLNAAVAILKEGGLVAFPTETVYGLAGNFSDKKAIEKVYEVKKRPRNKPLPVAIADKEKIEELACDISPVAYRLIDNFWPGPLTLILKSSESDEKIGIRMPDHNVVLKIIQKLGVPLVLTSANTSGNPAPHSAEEVLKDLDGLIDMVLDGGKTSLGKESTVIDATCLPFKILREGALNEQKIDEVANTKIILFVCTGNSCRSVMAKGLLGKLTKNREDIKVLSAGTAPGRLNATQETIDLLQEEGIDASAHRPVALTVNMIKSVDLILTMGRLHEERVVSLVPEAQNRVYLLKEFVNFDSDTLEIEDPIGRGMNVYRSCFVDIKEAVKQVAKLL